MTGGSSDEKEAHLSSNWRWAGGGRWGQVRSCLARLSGWRVLVKVRRQVLAEGSEICQVHGSLSALCMLHKR